MVKILSDVGELSVREMKNLLAGAYSALIKSGTPLTRFPSVMLWGPPGVGKSQGIRQVASEIEVKTGKRVAVTDVRLMLFNPVDLRGIPTANSEKTLAVWLKPKIFQMDEGEDVINILFLDEISAAPMSVQAAAYQITLDRTVGEHRLPDNCIVIAAGNRVTDKSVAYSMPKALANRLCHIEISSDSSAWISWAMGAGIHSLVIGFICSEPSMLMEGDGIAGDGVAFPTPRSWEMVSNILRYVSEDLDEVFPLIVGCVGNGAAHRFLSFSEVERYVPEVEEIFDGTEEEIPSRPDILYLLSARIVAYMRGHNSDAEVKNVVAYVSKLPREFKDRIFSDFLGIKKILRKLYNNAIYDNWFLRSSREWEDYGIS